MSGNYTLGRNYTVSGLSGATDLEVTRSGERIDVTTRKNPKPVKQYVAGLEEITFTGSVFANSGTKFEVGKGYTLTVNGDSLGELVCFDATREEPQDGVIVYKLTLKPGRPSEIANQIPIGPGTYRAGGGGGGGGGN